MALYSAKEAKWYRRNVERREHRQFNFPSLPPSPLPCFSSSFPSSFQVSYLRYGRIAKSIAKFESSNSFLFTPPLRRDLPSIDPQPKVRFNYITCYSCQATRGYKTTRARAVFNWGYHKYESRSHGTIEHLIKVVGPGARFCSVGNETQCPPIKRCHFAHDIVH